MFDKYLFSINSPLDSLHYKPGLFRPDVPRGPERDAPAGRGHRQGLRGAHRDLHVRRAAGSGIIVNVAAWFASTQILQY